MGKAGGGEAAARGSERVKGMDLFRRKTTPKGNYVCDGIQAGEYLMRNVENSAGILPALRGVDPSGVYIIIPELSDRAPRDSLCDTVHWLFASGTLSCSLALRPDYFFATFNQDASTRRSFNLSFTLSYLRNLFRSARLARLLSNNRRVFSQEIRGGALEIFLFRSLVDVLFPLRNKNVWDHLLKVNRLFSK